MMVNLGAAVNVVQAIRTHTAQQTGCPEWDAPGIRAMLTGSEGSPGSVLASACLAAEDPACLKPSPAALRNHWPVNAPSTPPRVPQLDMCPDHGSRSLTARRIKSTSGPLTSPASRRITDTAARFSTCGPSSERGSCCARRSRMRASCKVTRAR